MFKVKLWITVLLYIVAGALLVVLGTPRLHDALIPPFDVAADGAARVVAAELTRDAEASITAAAALTANEQVLAVARGTGELDDENKKALLAPATGRLGPPKFVAIVKKGGAVAALVGEGPNLGDNVAGLPIIADAETGVMRDGLLSVDGKTWILGAAPIVDTTGVVATVLLGWALDAAYVDKIGEATRHPVVLVANGARTGTQLQELDAAAVGGAGAEGVGALALELPLPLPLPLLVAETTRWVAASTPAVGLDKGAKFVSLIDRNEAFQTIGLLQLAVLAATLLPGFVIFLLVLNILRSISKPMQQIMDHLSAYAQGTSVGILPEGALSGPFVRLGKQINMILQAPPPGAAPRSGTSPLSPPSLPSDNGLGLGEGPPSAPFTDPGLGADEPSFDGIPGLGAPSGEESGPQAPVSDDLGGSALSSLFDEGGAGGDPLAAFRVGDDAGPPPAPPGMAPLPGGAPPPPPPETEPPAPADDGGLNPEATVMFQVPDQLIAESAQSGTGAAEPPVGAPPAAPVQEEEARTVIAQVPPELLNQAASIDRVTPEEESHFKEVYEEFVKAREQCGEDTDQLTYERFTAKLMKNRKTIIEKYNSSSVRFQVYVKQGKAALRAVPVRN